MGLDDVAVDIRAAGKARAEAILKEARQERDRLLAEAMGKAATLKEAKARETARGISQLKVQELSAADLDVKRNRLSMERDLLEAAAAKARDNIAALPQSEDEALLAALVKMGPQGYRIYSAKRNEAYIRSRTVIPYAGNITCLGGVIFESPDGAVRIDLTYDTILKEAVERSMKDIHDLLFPK